ncbi:TIGR03986 family CRISPR-associated RAMP protein [Frankia sp. CiP3]|uniref:TIGR03986 family type III CRISPR-associated RAMP protein n=1 Tax=Frankia sp. CiP3 TaxID=2880971 RepID=UPI001EF73B4F|nr:TIGR03986 family CRISPR-associated RAMP protein [Frankia sp. CiP3]
MSSRFGTIAWKTTADGARKLVIIEDGAGERRFERRFLDEALAGLSDDDLADRSVEFDWTGGRAKRIRAKGTAATVVAASWPAATATPQPARTPDRPVARQPPRHMAPARPARQATTAGRQRETPYRAPDPLNAFINPYGFIPAPQRDQSHEALGDVGGTLTDRGRLSGHDRLRADRWSGTIGVTLTVATPLLLLDTPQVKREENGHSTYGVLERMVTSVDGKAERRPHLPSTSVKGMLRSAYEAVTNSRFGVFTGHDARLGYRMPAGDGLKSIPARVIGDGETAEIELLPGTTPTEHQRKQGYRGNHGSPMHAAWLPAYWTPEGSKHVRSDQSDFNIVMPDGARPEHGAAVRARIQLVQHHNSKTRKPDFQLWWVRSLAEPDQEPPRVPPLPLADAGASRYKPIGPEKVVDGWVCVTNRNIKGKHDERVFFYDSEDDLRETFELDERLRRIWHDIIHSYRNAHRDGELKKPDPNEPEKILSSRHLLPPDDVEPANLTDGDLLYVRLDAHGEIDSLYPVTIARELFSVAPINLLDRSLRPAETISELSPADRVFGWVRTEDRSTGDRDSSEGGDPAGAWRGSLRIGPVVCGQSSKAAVERFEGRGLPLAILGQPKPGQGRFYIGTERAGHPAPLPSGLPKADWFVSTGRMLRGRKVYPHHAGLPEDYWKEPTADRTQKLDGGRYQEYRRPRKSTVADDSRANPLNRDGTAFATQHSGGVKDENRDDQNRSVNGWVRPGTTFTFTVDVRNLSEVELGALLWLLDLDNACSTGDGAAPGDGPRRFHRLGLGKPLGFGSVQLTVDPVRTDLRTGQSWAEYYQSLGPEQRPQDGFPAQARDSVDAFKKAVAPAGRFDDVPHIRAFLAASTGDPSVPVHYPRVRPNGLRVDVPVPPDPRGRSFEWFVQNERLQEPDRGVSLPDLAAGALPLPLPIHPAKER